MDKRSHLVSVVAHCHLNGNTKVEGLCSYAGVREELILSLIRADHGIVALPCPEITYLGMKRWGMTYEQYDVEYFRAHCRDILGPTVATLKELSRGGTRIVQVIGADGSPNCATHRTCIGYQGGEIEQMLQSTERAEDVEIRSGDAHHAGVFMEVFQEMLGESGLSIPFTSVEETIQVN